MRKPNEKLRRLEESRYPNIIKKLEEHNAELCKALELALPIVEHQSPTRAEEIKRLLERTSP